MASFRANTANNGRKLFASLHDQAREQSTQKGAAGSHPGEESPSSQGVLPDGWQAIEDDGYVFYYNKSTGESSWTLPGAVVSEVAHASKSGVVSNLGSRASSGSSDSDNSSSSGSDSDADLPPEWQEVEDDGYVYYFNSETGETSWIRPKPNKNAESEKQHKPSAAPPGTQVLVDPSSGCPYWFDPATGDMNWLPLDYQASNKKKDDTTLELDPSNIAQMKKRMTMQHKRRTMKAAMAMHAGMHGAEFMSGGSSGFGQTAEEPSRRSSYLCTAAGLEVHFDPSTGGAYTYDEASGDLRWLTLEESENLHSVSAAASGADASSNNRRSKQNSESEQKNDNDKAGDDDDDDDHDGLRWAWVHAAGSISGWRTQDEFKQLFGGMWQDIWHKAEQDDVPSREEFAKNLPWKEGKAQWLFYNDHTADLDLSLDPQLMAGGEASEIPAEPINVDKESINRFLKDVKKEGIVEGGTYRVSFNKWKGRFAKAWWMKVIKIFPHDELILMKHPDTGKEYEKPLKKWQKLSVKSKQ